MGRPFHEPGLRGESFHSYVVLLLAQPCVDHPRTTWVSHALAHAREVASDALPPSSPGRIHHCMRSIGCAQLALDLMIERVTDPARKTFGKYLYEHGTVVADIAKSRAEIESARLLVLSAAMQVGFW